MGIRVLLRYLAVIALVVICAPQLDKQLGETTTTVARHVQLVTEIKVETPSPVVEATPIVPTQNYPKQGCEAYRAEISRYDWNVETAIRVMKAESGCNTNAVGDNYPIRGEIIPSIGLFQIRTLRGRPSSEALKDPATNIAWAYKLYQASRWQPWSVCKNGMVSC